MLKNAKEDLAITKRNIKSLNVKKNSKRKTHSRETRLSLGFACFEKIHDLFMFCNVPPRVTFTETDKTVIPKLCRLELSLPSNGSNILNESYLKTLFHGSIFFLHTPCLVTFSFRDTNPTDSFDDTSSTMMSSYSFVPFVGQYWIKV